MGRHLAKLTLLTIPLGGCSLLYDPDRLAAAADAAPPPLDVRPCELKITDISPLMLYEGTGVGGSRPAVVVITGENLVNSNTRVFVKKSGEPDPTTLISLDNEKLEVGDHAQQLVAQVTVPIDTMTLKAGTTIPLDVTVTQDCDTGPVTVMLSGKIALKGLDELVLTGTTLSLVGGVQEFSQIDIGAAVAITPMAGQTMPIVLRSRSSVKIANASAIKLDATGRTGGPAGGTGGTGGSGLGGVGTPGTGPSPGQPSGGPGGFDNTDPGLNTLNNPNRSSGGAGGDGSTLGTGGTGGGGGGSIEISAGGDLQVGAISARGAAGTAGSGGAGAGGGGSGGAILLRAGGTLTAGDLDVRSAGTGVRGRARYDAGGTAMVNAGELGMDHLRGPMFGNLPFSVRTPKPEFTVLGKPLTAFKYFVFKPDGSVSSLTQVLFRADGTAKVTLSEELKPGANQICLVTESGSATSQTSNCADIAYLY
jgi:hypothetical protein